MITTATGNSRDILLSNQPQTFINLGTDTLLKNMFWSDYPPYAAKIVLKLSSNLNGIQD